MPIVYPGIGNEADWIFEGAEWVNYATPFVLFDESTAGSTAELTGSAEAAFDAAIADETPYFVAVTSLPGNTGSLGTLGLSMKGGTPGLFDFDGLGGGSTIVQEVTSGTGSGLVLEAATILILKCARVEIVPA